jgi:uncharacterized repeat protein (TIGR04138 family)
MTIYHPNISEIVRKDGRYAYEAYEFVYHALSFTQHRLGRLAGERGEEEAAAHVSGRELLFGIRDLALREFGLMARTVFRRWGINRTGDFGEIVFNLIDANLMKRRPEDSRDDFRDVYDLDRALVEGYSILPTEAD